MDSDFKWMLICISAIVTAYLITMILLGAMGEL